MTDARTYQRSLPRKRMGAGALFRDENGRFLLVNPTYKPTWEIPGGVIEANESPRQACIREIIEELGFTCQPHQLLCVDYLSDQPDKTEAIMFVFDGGCLSQEAIAHIQLPADELSDYRFCTLPEALVLLNPRLGRRVALCQQALTENRTIYAEDQPPV